jgi:hypothetical protein
MTVLAMLFPPMVADEALAGNSVALPFAGGKAVKIGQGYQGGTHQGRSRFGLDLVLADGGTSGAAAVAPFDGEVTWAQAPGAGNGCIAIAMKSGSHSVMMCHIIASKAFSAGEALKRGQTIGTVGAPGKVGNNGVAHIHYELHAGSRSSSPVPFAEPDGLPLEGVSLPASSTTAVVAKMGPITSSNGGAAPVVAQSAPRTLPMSSKEEPAPVAAASVPNTTRSVPAAATGAGSAATGTRRAVVQGTDSCLKVRKQPAADAAVVGCLKDGTEIALKPLGSGADPKWRQTDKGWVASEFLKRTEAVIAGTDACLNVRESAKASAAKLGCLPDGTAVKIVEGPVEKDGSAWYKVEATGSVDKSGWVVGKYLD